MAKNYQLVDSEEKLTELLNYLKDHEFVSFDIETNSVIEKVARVIGIAVTCDVDEGYYLPLAKWNGEELEDLYSEENEASIVKELCDILLTKKLVMHNGVFDVCCMIHSYGINLTEALFADTILMKHTVDEERPFGLKDLAVKYQRALGIPDDEVANQEQLELKESVIENGGKWTQKQKDMYKGDMNILAKYAVADVDLTARLFNYLSDKLEEEGLEDFFYEEEVMPLYKSCTIPMKLNGIFVDVDYFKNLEKELECDILKLTDKVFYQIKDDIIPLVESILDAKVNTTRGGKFAQEVLHFYSLPVPLNKKTGKPTLAKSALQTLEAEYPDHPAINFLLRGVELPKEVLYTVKKTIYVGRNPDVPHVFNLSSTKHLAWLLFDCHGLQPKAYSRKTNAPKVDKDSLHEFDLPFIDDLATLKKQEKLLSTYVKPILETNIEGWLYPSMLQFGTTSGRYSCGGKSINFQTLPRDDTRIKKGFIAPPGYKIVNSDFASLEPRIFSWVSKDPKLKEVWEKGHDLYSTIAIDVFDLKNVSADPEADNYLKKVEPEWRQLSKVFSLATVYGANAWRIASLMKVEVEEAQNIINKYLSAYPNLSDYMENQEFLIKREGKVVTEFGRVRHLPDAKTLHATYKNEILSKRSMKKVNEEFGEEIYYKFRNFLNLAKNFPIQATGAHVTNAAMIALSKAFIKENIEGSIVLQVHDEITCIIKEKHAKKAANLLKYNMEHNRITKQIDVPMIAEPIIGDNFAECK